MTSWMAKVEYLPEEEVKRKFSVNDITVVDYWLKEGVDYIVDGNTKLYTVSAVDRLKKFWRWVDEGLVERQVNMDKDQEEKSTTKYRRTISEIVKKYCNNQVRSLGRLIQERVDKLRKDHGFFQEVMGSVYSIDRESTFTENAILSSLVYYKYITDNLSFLFSRSIMEVRMKPMGFITEWVPLGELYSLSKVKPLMFKRYICRILVLIITDGIAYNIDGFVKYRIHPSAYFRADFAFSLMQFYHSYWVNGMFNKKPGYRWIRFIKLLDNACLRYLCILHRKTHGMDFRGMLLWQNYTSSTNLNRRWQR